MARSSAALKRPPAPPDTGKNMASSPEASSPSVASSHVESTNVASVLGLPLRPSLPEPSAPAGVPVKRGRQRSGEEKPRPAAIGLDAPVDGDVAVEHERRRGRGAQSNASGRYEPLARTSFDDG